ncbi:hypothetical protein Saci_1878 [Sulfolobus acidocaldarius DSM 639]|uniref:Uncharacterized protein n=1 Tax=Sulfolobus acidocaldarius (strain ATCC 33909 / DSM 639 / JCM 8929 / NBRC 15157 / NCIMB 11770) TaxID=330779 RepID=Q4J7P8_SULAC|nr:hypothetical protein Saci_1878 [Sulfolobus acidocaldarius DSM 639]
MQKRALDIIHVLLSILSINIASLRKLEVICGYNNQTKTVLHHTCYESFTTVNYISHQNMGVQILILVYIMMTDF